MGRRTTRGAHWCASDRDRAQKSERAAYLDQFRSVASDRGSARAMRGVQVVVLGRVVVVTGRVLKAG